MNCFVQKLFFGCWELVETERKINVPRSRTYYNLVWAGGGGLGGAGAGVDGGGGGGGGRTCTLSHIHVHTRGGAGVLGASAAAPAQVAGPGRRPAALRASPTQYERLRRSGSWTWSYSRQWLSTMLEAGVEADTISFNTVIQGCAEAGYVARAEHWLAMILKAWHEYLLFQKF